jgi:hypothetical protein
MQGGMQILFNAIGINPEELKKTLSEFVQLAESVRGEFAAIKMQLDRIEAKLDNAGAEIPLPLLLADQSEPERNQNVR